MEGTKKDACEEGAYRTARSICILCSKSQFSLAVTERKVTGLHCYNIGRASPVRLLVFGAPGTDGEAKVRAFVVDLGVVTHGKDRTGGRIARLRNRESRESRSVK